MDFKLLMNIIKEIIYKVCYFLIYKCRKCRLELNKPKHNLLKLSLNNSSNIRRFLQFKGESIMASD